MGVRADSRRVMLCSSGASMFIWQWDRGLGVDDAQESTNLIRARMKGLGCEGQNNNQIPSVSLGPASGSVVRRSQSHGEPLPALAETGSERGRDFPDCIIKTPRDQTITVPSRPHHGTCSPPGYYIIDLGQREVLSRNSVTSSAREAVRRSHTTHLSTPQT